MTTVIPQTRGFVVMDEQHRPKRPSLWDRVRYMFDKSMSAGTVALIGWLGALSLAIIIVASVLIVVMGIAPEGESAPHNFLETGWESLMRTIDPGTVGGDVGWGYRAVMLAVTFAGIFIFSALIGVLSTGLEARIAELRKGRSRVLESGHSIILNWSPSIVDIIGELGQANAGRKKLKVVILAGRDKVEMEDEIASKLKLRRVRVICRSGDPCDPTDLAIVNPGEAKSIIVLAPEGEDADAQVIKTVLAITNGPGRSTRPLQVVAEVREAGNVELARTVGGSEVQVVLADDLIARILVQSTRQSGLSGVFSELLGFDGSEIYTAHVPALAGKTFGEALGCFDAGVLIGLCDDARVQINPNMDTLIAPTDRVIAIAENQRSIHLRTKGPAPFDTAAICEQKAVHIAPKRILMLGWNRRGPGILREISRFVRPGSQLTIAADAPQFEASMAMVGASMGNLSIQSRLRDTTRAATLAELDATSYDHIIVLGYTDNKSAQAADTHTLVTLLQLRRLIAATGRPINVVSEMVDARNRTLAEVTGADDFVVSNQLVSLMLAQASENKYLSAIFDELLSETGSEIYIRPVADYVSIERPLTFHTLIEAARLRGEVAIGYRSPRGAALHTGGVVINPRLDKAHKFEAMDSIVVLARE